MINGNLELQYNSFMNSRHFSTLYESIRNRFPDKEISETFMKKKISFRMFKKMKSNCVREETRASCVDPIEAKCYDTSRAIQLFFRGVISTIPRLRDHYLQEHNDLSFYDPYIDDDSSCDSDINREDFDMVDDEISLKNR
jgi:hypothetical protein